MLFILVVMPGVLASGLVLQEQNRAALSSAAPAAMPAGPDSLLAARSPGARGDGDFLVMKSTFAPPGSGDGAMGPDGQGPVERVLSQIRTRPGEIAPFGGDSDPSFVMPLLLNGPLLPVPASFAGPPAGPPGLAVPTGDPTFIAPPGGGGGGGGIVVPEPSTWFMMLIGFFLVGHSLRRRIARARLAPPVMASG